MDSTGVLANCRALAGLSACFQGTDMLRVGRGAPKMILSTRLPDYGTQWLGLAKETLKQRTQTDPGDLVRCWQIVVTE